jgi:hypothetical protein
LQAALSGMTAGARRASTSDQHRALAALAAGGFAAPLCAQRRLLDKARWGILGRGRHRALGDRRVRVAG